MFAIPSSIQVQPFDGASYAFSLRKLYPHYTGSCIRIQDSSTSTEWDIGFNGDLVDTSAITTNVPTNTARVVTWYDQSGNNKDVTWDSSSGGYPTIAVAGTVHTINSLPAIFFGITGDDAEETALARASESTAISGQTNGSNYVAIVMQQDGAKPRNGIWGHDFAGSGARFDVYATYFNEIYYDAGNFSGLRINVAQPSGWDDSHRILHCHNDGATSQIYANNSQLASAAKTGTVTHSSKKLTIGAAWGGSSYAPNDGLRGYLQEVVVWNHSHTPNRSQLYTDQSNYWF